MLSRLLVLSLSLWTVAVAGCSTPETTSREEPASGARAQLFDGMGPHRREVTTTSPEAQRYFDQGLTWSYAFNHDEAVRSFTRAAEIDPDCAMAWWGVALCQGPNYNDPIMTEERSTAAWDLHHPLGRIPAAGAGALVRSGHHAAHGPSPRRTRAARPGRSRRRRRERRRQ